VHKATQKEKSIENKNKKDSIYYSESDGSSIIEENENSLNSILSKRGTRGKNTKIIDEIKNALSELDEEGLDNRLLINEELKKPDLNEFDYASNLLKTLTSFSNKIEKNKEQNKTKQQQIETSSEDTKSENDVTQANNNIQDKNSGKRQRQENTEKKMQKEQELLRIKQEIEQINERKRVLSAREEEKNQAIDSLAKTLNSRFKDKVADISGNPTETRIATLRNRNSAAQENKETASTMQTSKGDDPKQKARKNNTSTPATQNHCNNRLTTKIDESRILTNESGSQKEKDLNDSNGKSILESVKEKQGNGKSSNTYAEATKSLPTSSREPKAVQARGENESAKKAYHERSDQTARPQTNHEPSNQHLKDSSVSRPQTQVMAQLQMEQMAPFFAMMMQQAVMSLNTTNQRQMATVPLEVSGNSFNGFISDGARSSCTLETSQPENCLANDDHMELGSGPGTGNDSKIILSANNSQTDRRETSERSLSKEEDEEDLISGGG
jgi:hypothetical protein